MKRTEVFVGLGSNIGDRALWLEKARAAIHLRLGRLTNCSSVVETAPVGMAPDTPYFLNQVVGVELSCSPLEAMQILLSIEEGLGRQRNKADSELAGATGGERWASRTIDCDLLLWPDFECSTPALTLPHPRLLERDFALGPLAEIAPNVEIPGTQITAAEAFKHMDKP